jgi:hypothetical protein
MQLSQRVNGEVEQLEIGGVSFAEEYDVIVVGLGTAGAIAVIAAAQRGCSVLGLESLHCMGGTHTAGAIQNYYFGSKGGIYETLDEQIRQVEHDGYTAWGGTNGELKKYFLEQNALQSGVNVRYESTVIGVFRDGKTVKGLRWISPDGVREAASKMVIDCTGNAEVAIMAGCEVRQGRAIDGQGQPFSNVIEMIVKNRASKFYTDSGYVNPADGDDVSRAIIESATSPNHLKDYYDDENRMVRLTPILGVREGAFIIGEEDVTFAKFQQGNVTQQPAFFAYSNLDNHSKDVAFESEAQQDWIVAASLWGLNFSVPVPLGALIPKGFEGILAAGRCIALDHDIASCVRMNRDAQKCGEVAAAAAAIAITQNTKLREIEYEAIAPQLRETGCLNENAVHFVDTSAPKIEDSKVVAWLTDENEIREGLSGDKPGIAIWSSKRLGAEINPRLREWVSQSQEEKLYKNSAIALALQNDMAALPILRQMIRNRDSYVPKTSRKYNQAHGHSAIYLIGKLADREIVPDLIELLDDRAAFKNLQGNAEFVSDDDDLYCQTVTLSLMALLRIGAEHADLRNHLLSGLKNIVYKDKFDLSVTLKGSKVIRHSLTEKIRDIVSGKEQEWKMV